MKFSDLKEDLIFKTYEESYSWSNKKFVPCVREVVNNGRTYYKTGNLQYVKFVGIKYKLDTPDNMPQKRMLLVGMARQNETDINCNSDAAEEIASYNANVRPIIYMEVGKNFDDVDFTKLIERYYISSVHENLRFVKTVEEGGHRVNFYPYGDREEADKLKKQYVESAKAWVNSAN